MAIALGGSAICGYRLAHDERTDHSYRLYPLLTIGRAGCHRHSQDRMKLLDPRRETAWPVSTRL
jgi:hypothetical protein